MWVTGKLSGGHVFFSANVDERDPRKIAIRCRNEQDAARVAHFLGKRVTPTPKGDYEWRVIASKKDLGRLLIRMARNVDYRNYKNTMASGSPRARAHHSAWTSFLTLRSKQPDKSFSSGKSAFDVTDWPMQGNGPLGGSKKFGTDQQLSLVEPAARSFWVGDQKDGHWEQQSEIASKMEWRKDPWRDNKPVRIVEDRGDELILSDSAFDNEGLEVIVKRREWDTWEVTSR
jgi:hypothetical protein